MLFARPAGDAHRIGVDLIFRKNLRGNGGDGVAEDELAALRESGRRNADDLAAIDLAKETLDLHVLGDVAVAHERGVLLQETGEAIGADQYAAAVGDVGVAENFLRVKDELVRVGLGSGGGVIRTGIRGDLTEGVGIDLGDLLQANLPRAGLPSVFSKCYRKGFLSLASCGFPQVRRTYSTRGVRVAEHSWGNYSLQSRIIPYALRWRRRFSFCAYLGISV